MRQLANPAGNEAVNHNAEGVIAASADTTSDGSADLTLLDLGIIDAVVAGCSNQEIAVRLLTTETAVEQQLSSIFKRLRVVGRLELALFAIDRWLVGRSHASRC
jgi:DNA-binding NarL/FixJ family response regulator